MTYARFYKADLQMQTPADRVHWRGPEYLNPDSSPEDRAAVAEAFVERCYDEALEVIAITEHNLAMPDCPSLIPELLAAIQRLAPSRGYEIALFPGFEIEVPLGRGVHVLCLFEPGTSVETLSDKLTQLGLPPQDRFDRDGAVPIRDSSGLTRDKLVSTVQTDPRTPGLVVLAHAASGKGVMDGDQLVQWWSMDVIKDERLLCMELPRSRDHYLSLDGQPLSKSVLQNKDPRYGRAHAIASICSSDCKSLEPVEGSEGNYIGFRSTWIKMTAPSIEGLRQAFLDHESRVRFGGRPEDGYTHARLLSAHVRNAIFLTDQDVAFSPNLNVIIGGSGTGKSTLLDYLRMNLGQAEEIRGADVRKNHDKSLQTVRDGTQISVVGQLEDQTLTVTSTGRSRGVVTSGSTTLDGTEVAEVFPVRFFGQREIYNIAEDRAATVALVDDLHRDELARLSRDEQAMNAALNAVAQRALEVAPLKRELATVRAQRARSLTARDRLLEAAAPLEEQAKTEDRLAALSSLLRSTESLRPRHSDSLDSAAEELRSIDPAGDVALLSIRDAIEAALTTFASKLADALDELEEQVARLSASDTASAIRGAATEAAETTASIRQSLADQGIDVDQFTHYRNEVTRLEQEEASILERLVSAEQAEAEKQGFQAEFEALWAEQTRLRREAASRLNGAVPRTEVGAPFVEVSVHAYGDDRAFRERVSKFRGDRRRLSDDDWNTLIESVVRASQDTSPSHTLLEWVEEVEAGNSPDGYPWGDAYSERFLACFPPNERFGLIALRVPDRVEVQLRRDDGSIAGDIEAGLSIGQKCTAVLALLLAADTSPVVIDQPEDEIDNEFTYRQMVPLIRRVKERRQIVLVTHDPNLPVNADAEMIYALEASEGRGRLKRLNGLPATGSLDQVHVRLAVEEIMEGSEEAFRRRFVKYGFRG